MKKYIRFEIEKRKFSANCVIGIYLFTNNNGEIVEKNDRILAPFLLKNHGGDYLAQKTCDYYNNISEGFQAYEDEKEENFNLLIEISDYHSKLRKLKNNGKLI